MYKIKVQQFEGPFEILIELIEQKKLSINQVSLAEIANQYLNYLKQLGHFPLKEASSFIVTAATLMLIKSRSLMPSLKLSREEELEIEDFENQLRLYKRFRMISREIEKILGKQIIFAPQKSRFLAEQKGEACPEQGRRVFIAPEDLTINNLKISLEQMLNGLPQKEILPETIVKKTITLEEKINGLIERLESKVNLCFSELKNDPECKKVDLIVNFLAMLELIKRNFIAVRQEEKFGEIEIIKL